MHERRDVDLRKRREQRDEPRPGVRHVPPAHARPRVAVRGTVYATGHEPDNCVGHASTASSTVEVIITDSAGRELVTTTNPGGNFIIFENVATPYRARVRCRGRERAMTSQQSDGDCNSCHTQSGSRGAPGRIVLP